MKVLMVCLGNICRSPMAQGILEHKIKQHGLDWEVDSAGTSHWHEGESPDPRAIAIMKKHGIDISNQRARQFRIDDLDRFDVIYVMDRSNLADVIRHAGPAQRTKVKLIMEELYPGKQMDVPDPYWNDDGFEKVYNMLDRACDRIIAQYANTIN